ncbi:MAG: hypothetical protein ACLUNO_06800 [Oscillospiraceae bacterium]
MKMFIQITLCALLILGFAWLLRMLGCTLLTPVRSSRDARLTLVIRARGDAPELEQLLRGIRWLREGGTARGGRSAHRLRPDGRRGRALRARGAAV